MDGLVDETDARADLAELARAARACAALLRQAAARARARIGSDEAESPMAHWVIERLG